MTTRKRSARIALSTAQLFLLVAGLVWHAGTDHGATDQRLRDGCVPSCEPSARDEYGGSVLENRLALGAPIAGGATVITGTALLFMNRPQLHRTEDRGGMKLELRPAASLDAAALSARLVF
ncbi:uncharacterized protein SOCE26_040830 [Sorangium cellulosum]|uniref:Secreted protein n=1 Tax=Sorangium cellulosum TaxID=56 RepID=A0A2L0ETN6_SORCE|nr:hypothetical protein [Sorangium cellulosum]AUX42650.1 uncharacterized protein SOCE26_040830 [Sorangium cellulosum]